MSPSSLEMPLWVFVCKKILAYTRQLLCHKISAQRNFFEFEKQKKLYILYTLLFTVKVKQSSEIKEALLW